MTFVTVTKCRNFKFVTSVTRSVFFNSFFSKTGLVIFWSQLSQMVAKSNMTGTNLFLFLFRLKWFRMNEIRPNIPESELCFCFLFGIRIRTALRPKGFTSKVCSYETTYLSHVQLLYKISDVLQIDWLTNRSKRSKDTRKKFTRRQTNLL